MNFLLRRKRKASTTLVATIFSYEANEEEEYELGNGDAVEIQKLQQSI
ncbi:hypothetical protein O9992_09590 [Vibrio lentus]|nr:hypothetical protein [Vibrio lentus]